MPTDPIARMLEQIGAALSAGDVQQASTFWIAPALVLSDAGATAVSDIGEIEALFSRAGEWYHAQGLVSTRPEIERIEKLSDTLASVDVRWPSFNAAGEETFSERSHYIVQIADDQAYVRVALTRTV
jgi:hypothetical protein